MPHDPRKSLEDICRAGTLVAQFLGTHLFDNYVANEMLHAAVERELMIVGEAMTRLS